MSVKWYYMLGLLMVYIFTILYTGKFNILEWDVRGYSYLLFSGLILSISIFINFKFFKTPEQWASIFGIEIDRSIFKNKERITKEDFLERIGRK